MARKIRINPREAWLLMLLALLGCGRHGKTAEPSARPWDPFVAPGCAVETLVHSNPFRAEVVRVDVQTNIFGPFRSNVSLTIVIRRPTGEQLSVFQLDPTPRITANSAALVMGRSYVFPDALTNSGSGPSAPAK